MTMGGRVGTPHPSHVNRPGRQRPGGAMADVDGRDGRPGVALLGLLGLLGLPHPLWVQSGAPCAKSSTNLVR